MPAWRIYYDDGSTFSDEDGGPEAAPSEGFVCAVGYDERGQRYIMHGWDFYQWDDEGKQWWGMDRYGLHDRLRRNLVFAYKEGRTVTRTQFEALIARAHADADFPQ
ncbi:MAG TPA: hypothetical protein VLB27_10525 [candidate division Zixibacteria bacterium]|nr:hypothetical protein [candidate division Zixibacteria bacterium]